MRMPILVWILTVYLALVSVEIFILYQILKYDFKGPSQRSPSRVASIRYLFKKEKTVNVTLLIRVRIYHMALFCLVLD